MLPSSSSSSSSSSSKFYKANAKLSEAVSTTTLVSTPTANDVPPEPKSNNNKKRPRSSVALSLVRSQNRHPHRTLEPPSTFGLNTLPQSFVYAVDLQQIYAFHPILPFVSPMKSIVQTSNLESGVLVGSIVGGPTPMDAHTRQV